jgi:hypothetical protein
MTLHDIYQLTYLVDAVLLRMLQVTPPTMVGNYFVKSISDTSAAAAALQLKSVVSVQTPRPLVF